MKFLFLVLITSSIIYSKSSIAVLPIVSSGIDSQQVSTFQKKIEYEVQRLNKYIMVDRINIQKVLQEQALQLTGIISDSSMIEIGKLLNANQLLICELNVFNNIYYLSLKIIDVESGQILASDFLDIKGSFIDLLLGGSKYAISRLFGIQKQIDDNPQVERVITKIQIIEKDIQTQKRIFQVCPVCQGKGVEDLKNGHKKTCSYCRNQNRYAGPETNHQYKSGKWVLTSN